MYYDCLVVGAGPAGASTAMTAAKNGVKVLIIDKKKIIGEPVQCAEFVPEPLTGEVEIKEDCIANRVHSLITYLPDGTSLETSSPGIILNRQLFDRSLVIEAVRAGAELWIETKFVSLNGNKALLFRHNRSIEIEARIIVGADGPASSVGKAIGEKNSEYVFGMGYELALVKQMTHTEVYFDKEFFGGYAWHFPKKLSANVGAGIRLSKNCSKKLKVLLDKFVKKLSSERKVFARPLSKTWGLIPVGGPLNTVKGNILLVGDAGGQTHPITGAGISQAIVCGKLAGEAIARALKKDDLKELSSYDDEWQKLYLNELKRAMAKRKFMEENWQNLDKILKKCWVIFPEYYG